MSLSGSGGRGANRPSAVPDRRLLLQFRGLGDFPLSKAPNACRNGCLGRRNSETIEPTDPGIWGMPITGSTAAPRSFRGGRARHAAHLANDPDPEFVPMVVAAIAFVDIDAAGLDPAQLFEFGNHRPQGVAVEGVAVQRLRGSQTGRPPLSRGHGIGWRCHRRGGTRWQDHETIVKRTCCGRLWKRSLTSAMRWYGWRARSIGVSRSALASVCTPGPGAARAAAAAGGGGCSFSNTCTTRRTKCCAIAGWRTRITSPETAPQNRRFLQF